MKSLARGKQHLIDISIAPKSGISRGGIWLTSGVFIILAWHYFKLRSGGAKGAETWVSDVALWRSRRCWCCNAAASRSDAATLLTLRHCDAGAALRRCWCCDAATRDATTLLALRRFLLQECTRRGFAARHAKCI